ncbi:winged helix-turn-helix domain-containing protein [Desertibaculum subflavum]|uniref:winged helix-turn-helix domain-containing protein n=1 Tax=Desertibaculum subflavum TaxID=2268458 RepID=UPI000E665DE4
MPFIFEDCVLDTGRRELSRGAEVVAIGPQVFDLLVYLVSNRQRVVSKDDLLDAVWGGRIVSESTITSHINAVRRAIGDSGQEQRLLRTVARKGFRFVGAVSETPLSDRPGTPDAATGEVDGRYRLKTIAHPLREANGAGHEQARLEAALPLPDKPSIAVLPFENMSGDIEQDYFADGIAEDVITLLSRSRALFVIARNSSFIYKGRTVDMKQVGRELGVRYVLEGSVRKAGNRVRVTGQLVEAATASHLWAERYDRDLTDIFVVQDEIAASVSAAILPAMERSESERAARKPPDSLDAWDCYYRGMWHFAKIEAVEIENARTFFRRALDLDPRFAPAAAALSLNYMNEMTIFRPDLRAVNIPLARDHARHAVSIDATDAAAHAALARAFWMSGRHAESLAEADIAVRCNPNSAAAHGACGGARLWGGLPRDAIEPLQTAMRLSPFDPLMPLWRHFVALAQYWSEDYERAVAAARRLRQSFPDFRLPYYTLIAALGQVGNAAKARAVMDDALEKFGEAFRILMRLPADELLEFRPDDRERLIDGFRKAGLA